MKKICTGVFLLRGVLVMGLGHVPCALYLLHLWVSLQLSLHGSAISEGVLACFVGAVI